MSLGKLLMVAWLVCIVLGGVMGFMLESHDGNTLSECHTVEQVSP